MKKQMSKERLQRYAKLRAEIEMLENQIHSAQMEGDEFVWDTVQDGTTGVIKPIVISGYGSNSIPRLCKRRNKHEIECAEIEAFIDGVDDSSMRQIFARRYIEGKSLDETSALVGYSKEHISRKINTFFSKVDNGCQ